jgi:hypothetical protein
MSTYKLTFGNYLEVDVSLDQNSIFISSLSLFDHRIVLQEAGIRLREQLQAKYPEDMKLLAQNYHEAAAVYLYPYPFQVSSLGWNFDFHVEADFSSVRISNVEIIERPSGELQRLF